MMAQTKTVTTNPRKIQKKWKRMVNKRYKMAQMRNEKKVSQRRKQTNSLYPFHLQLKRTSPSQIYLNRHQMIPKTNRLSLNQQLSLKPKWSLQMLLIRLLISTNSKCPSKRMRSHLKTKAQPRMKHWTSLPRLKSHTQM